MVAVPRREMCCWLFPTQMMSPCTKFGPICGDSYGHMTRELMKINILHCCEIELKISSEGVQLSNPKPGRVQIAEEADDNDDGEKEKDADVGT
ncbi:hypothetical protein ABKV19_012797 [Rosa sericea]